MEKAIYIFLLLQIAALALDLALKIVDLPPVKKFFHTIFERIRGKPPGPPDDTSSHT